MSQVNRRKLELAAGCLAYTICQVPVITQLANTPRIEIYLTDGTTIKINGNHMDAINSRHIFQRDGIVHHLMVYLMFASFTTD